ncbi:Zinc finger, CCHC-type [Sesbania bispinosa]|nr:Zinc finger, CCHC-type [Sesbania bispinosa]
MEEVSLSSEEADILRRSTTKQKPLVELVSHDDDVVDQNTSVTTKSLFPTATEVSLSRKLVSYKDICLGSKGDDKGVEEDGSEGDSSEQESSESEGSDYEDDFVMFDPLCPVVSLSKEERKRICHPWKRAIIVKLLGRRISLRMLKNRLSKLWQPKSGMDNLDLENDYFLINFNNSDDLDDVFERGPWMIQDHYLVIQKWRPEFFPFEDDLKNVAVWIRIPCLPVEYYDQLILKRIGDTLGRTVKIDGNTLKEKVVGLGELYTERAKFARICIEVNLQQPLISRFELNGQRYKVEYEGLHLVCFKCGRYGHRRKGCPTATGEGPKDAVVNNDPMGVTPKVTADSIQVAGKEPPTRDGFGPWMLVQKGELEENQSVANVSDPRTDADYAAAITDTVRNDKKETFPKSKESASGSKSRKSGCSNSPKSVENSQSKSRESFPANNISNHEETRVPHNSLTSSEVGPQKENKKVAVGNILKGRMGVHTKSRVSFKGVRDAARRGSNSHPTWITKGVATGENSKGLKEDEFLKSCIVLGPMILCRTFASSSKPSDEEGRVTSLSPSLSNFTKQDKLTSGDDRVEVGVISDDEAMGVRWIFGLS